MVHQTGSEVSTIIETKYERALQWATQYLTSHLNLHIIHHQKVVQTAYSIVHKVETNQGIFYLKQTPEALFFEATMLAFLHQQGCENIPELLTENRALHCFIMPACGEDALRQIFQGNIDLNQLASGISNYTKIQRSLENKVPALLSLGTPDWRLNQVAALYDQLIQQNRLLIDDGLTDQEITRLHQLYPTCIQLCEDLAKYRIPETINHCDFQANNMLLDKKTGAVNMIDWGEVVIAHPFFSHNSCLWNLTYFNKLKQTDRLYGQIQSQCVTAWLDLHPEETLLKAFKIAKQLNGIFAALAYERIYLATKDQPKTLQEEHPGSIAGCLRTFLANVM